MNFPADSVLNPDEGAEGEEKRQGKQLTEISKRLGPQLLIKGLRS